MGGLPFDLLYAEWFYQDQSILAGLRETSWRKNCTGWCSMSNSIDGLSFSLFFARDFEGPEIASEIIRVFLSSNRSVRPVKYGVFGPDEDIVDAASVADTLMNIESPDGRSRSGSLILERNRGCGYQVQWNKSNQPGFSFIGGHLMFSSYGKHGGALDGF